MPVHSMSPRGGALAAVSVYVAKPVNIICTGTPRFFATSEETNAVIKSKLISPY